MKTTHAEAVEKGVSGPYSELLMLVGTHHLHQHDSYLLDPLLACAKTAVCPPAPCHIGEVYLLNTQCLLKFLHKVEMHNGLLDLKAVEKNIDKHKKQYIAYVYKTPEGGEAIGNTPMGVEEEEIQKESENKEGGSQSAQSSSN